MLFVRIVFDVTVSSRNCSAVLSRPENDLFCVGWDVKPIMRTHSLVTMPCFDSDARHGQVGFIVLTSSSHNYKYTIQEDLFKMTSRHSAFSPTFH